MMTMMPKKEIFFCHCLQYHQLPNGWLLLASAVAVACCGSPVARNVSRLSRRQRTLTVADSWGILAPRVCPPPRPPLMRWIRNVEHLGRGTGRYTAFPRARDGTSNAGLGRLQDMAGISWRHGVEADNSLPSFRGRMLYLALGGGGFLAREFDTVIREQTFRNATLTSVPGPYDF